jgi:hypothetical protein
MIMALPREILDNCMEWYNHHLPSRGKKNNFSNGGDKRWGWKKKYDMYPIIKNLLDRAFDIIWLTWGTCISMPHS